MLYLVSFNALPERSSTNYEEYNRLQNYYLGIFLFFFGLPQGFMGFLMKPLAKKINCYQIAYYGSLLTTLLMLTTVVVFYLGVFWLDCVVAFLWGVVMTIHRSNLYSLVSKHFNNNLEMFAVKQFIAGISFTIFVIIISLLLKLTTIVAFSFQLVMYVLITKSAWTIMRRDQRVKT